MSSPVSSSSPLGIGVGRSRRGREWEGKGQPNWLKESFRRRIYKHERVELLSRVVVLEGRFCCCLSVRLLAVANASFSLHPFIPFSFSCFSLLVFISSRPLFRAFEKAPALKNELALARLFIYSPGLALLDCVFHCGREACPRVSCCIFFLGFFPGNPELFAFR